MPRRMLYGREVLAFIHKRRRFDASKALIEHRSKLRGSIPPDATGHRVIGSSCLTLQLLLQYEVLRSHAKIHQLFLRCVECADCSRRLRPGHLLAEARTRHGGRTCQLWRTTCSYSIHAYRGHVYAWQRTVCHTAIEPPMLPCLYRLQSLRHVLFGKILR